MQHTHVKMQTTLGNAIHAHVEILILAPINAAGQQAQGW